MIVEFATMLRRRGNHCVQKHNLASEGLNCSIAVCHETSSWTSLYSSQRPGNANSRASEKQCMTEIVIYLKPLVWT